MTETYKIVNYCYSSATTGSWKKNSMDKWSPSWADAGKTQHPAGSTTNPKHFWMQKADTTYTSTYTNDEGDTTKYYHYTDMWIRVDLGERAKKGAKVNNLKIDLITAESQNIDAYGFVVTDQILYYQREINGNNIKATNLAGVHRPRSLMNDILPRYNAKEDDTIVAKGTGFRKGDSSKYSAVTLTFENFIMPTNQFIDINLKMDAKNLPTWMGTVSSIPSAGVRGNEKLWRVTADVNPEYSITYTDEKYYSYNLNGELKVLDNLESYGLTDNSQNGIDFESEATLINLYKDGSWQNYEPDNYDVDQFIGWVTEDESDTPTLYLFADNVTKVWGKDMVFYPCFGEAI